MKKTYRGSCHCGAVRFECDLDLAPAEQRSAPELPGVWWTSTFRCDCTYCLKTRMWKGFVRAKDFRATAGDEVLGDYLFGTRAIHHRFCKACGVTTYASASMEQLGGDFYAVNIACLDDATPEELERAPITYEDGANDAWDRPPARTRHL
ncbi:GFA family protein [Sandaracinus amylolyticus]|uniref:GFA family protein n=1 Tax=Sandaracinus amylolyticus TaxID=927083 RepID=UPI00069EF066|nr:GFA family protein [Sandaracinus amylolyticus]